MALIRFETNSSVPEDGAKILLNKLAKAIADMVGEPQSAVRVEIAANRRMRMAESDEPIAHLEIRNVEFPKDRAVELTEAVCPVIEEAISISSSNIYIAVISSRNSMWRVNGDAGNFNKD